MKMTSPPMPRHVSRGKLLPRERVEGPPRDSDPQKLLLAPKKCSLWRFPVENISWVQVAFLGVGIARAGRGPAGPRDPLPRALAARGPRDVRR
jgi:hypothetical protein